MLCKYLKPIMQTTGKTAEIVYSQKIWHNELINLCIACIICSEADILCGLS